MAEGYRVDHQETRKVDAMRLTRQSSGPARKAAQAAHFYVGHYMKPIDVTLTDYQLMVALFENESDRGAAVLAGSYVENHLGLYLRSKVIDPSVADRIFSSEGPLSTFSQRIDLAYAFGFISKEQWSDLHLIKKIRNYFAHHPKEASFDAKPVADWIGNLIATRIKATMPDGTKRILGDARFRYLTSAGMFVVLTTPEAQ